jgi:TolB-like protein/Flp pilus assembly protein TadD
MFTDMVGYTALGQRNESLSLALVEEQRKIVRSMLARHNGREIKTMGDAFLIEFPNALDAVRCAYDIQRAAREYNMSVPEEKRIHLRVGLHLGDVVESEGDISGDAVNVASRIEPLADSGGVCLTRPVYDSTHAKFEVPLVSMGVKTLKNVVEPVEVYRAVLPWENQTSREEILDPRRLAVLPFVSLSPDPDDEYFADGLTEELITRISLVKGLEVIARTSAMNYKKEKKNVSQIGRELRVGTLLEGSVRKAGNRIRVSAQLINARTEGHLWAESYDRDLADVFEVQSGIAQNVVESLRVRLLPEEEQEIRREPVRNPEAYSIYLRGLQFCHEDSVESQRKSVRYFEHSTELDPAFSPAYLEAAKVFFDLGAMGYMQPTDARTKAEAMLAKAEAIEPDSVGVHKALASRCYGSYDWSGADAHLRKAIELSPSDAEARRTHATVLQVMGKLDEALSEANKSSELDPFWTKNTTRVSVLYYARKYDEAVTEALMLIDREPELFNAHIWLGYTYLMKSMFAEAIAEFQKTVEFARGELTNWSVADLAVAFVKSGRKEEAKKILNDLQALSEREYVPPDILAVINWELGNADLALQQFEMAFKQRSQAWIQWLGVDPLFDDLRADQRFVPFLRKVGFLG